MSRVFLVARVRREPYRYLAVLLWAAGLSVAALAVAWFWWLPHHRPALEAGERYGVDVSNHQGVIDWTAVAADDVDFAYIKATEGGDFVDAHFADNWRAAQEAGLLVGAYHFFTLCTDGAVQAANVLATVPHETLDLPIALDLEFGGNCSARPSTAALLSEVDEFISLVEAATGTPLLIYVLDDFESRYPSDELRTRERWERLLWRRPDPPWLVWQWSNRSSVDGITGGVDMNVAVLAHLVSPA